jgi:hypothetical protein
MACQRDPLPVIPLTLAKQYHTAVAPSPRVCRIAAMFGLGVDQQRQVTVVPPITLKLHAGQVVFVTGASGGGKSTLLDLIREALNTGYRDVRVIDFQQLNPPGDRPLVDCFDAPLEPVVRWLSLAGLNDAFVMLRRPGELSDGQRYRLRLAQALAAVESSTDAAGDIALTVVLADEFAATLDRPTARVIARNIRKAVTRLAGQGRPVCFIAVTSHDDLLETLQPDTLVVQEPGEQLLLLERPDTTTSRPVPEASPETTNPQPDHQADAVDR